MVPRTKPVDVLFVIDATASTEPVFQCIRDQIADQAFFFHCQNREVLDSYGVVVYRDPVDHPEDRHDFLQFTDKREIVEDFLAQVESYGGRDDPEDWAGALKIALQDLKWRNGKRCIFWITDANAHGTKFSGDPHDRHNDQTAILEKYIQEMARQHIYFVGINIMKGTDSGCEHTLHTARPIYMGENGPSFQVGEFRPVWDRDKFDGDGWPFEVMEMFQKTINATLTRALARFVH
jgi:hypothetical protein